MSALRVINDVTADYVYGNNLSQPALSLAGLTILGTNFSVPDSATTNVTTYTASTNTDASFFTVDATAGTITVTVAQASNLLISAGGKFAVNSTGFRFLGVASTFTGSPFPSQTSTAATGISTQISPSGILTLSTPGTYVFRLTATQTSGGPLNLTDIRFTIKKIY